jgi:hypothetical protein
MGGAEFRPRPEGRGYEAGAFRPPQAPPGAGLRRAHPISFPPEPPEGGLAEGIVAAGFSPRPPPGPRNLLCRGFTRPRQGLTVP